MRTKSSRRASLVLLAVLGLPISPLEAEPTRDSDLLAHPDGLQTLSYYFYDLNQAIIMSRIIKNENLSEQKFVAQAMQNWKTNTKVTNVQKTQHAKETYQGLRRLDRELNHLADNGLDRDGLAGYLRVNYSFHQVGRTLDQLKPLGSFTIYGQADPRNASDRWIDRMSEQSTMFWMSGAGGVFFGETMVPANSPQPWNVEVYLKSVPRIALILEESFRQGKRFPEPKLVSSGMQLSALGRIHHHFVDYINASAQVSFQTIGGAVPAKAADPSPP